LEAKIETYLQKQIKQNKIQKQKYKNKVNNPTSQASQASQGRNDLIKK